MESTKSLMGMLYIVVQLIGTSSAASAAEKVREAKKALEYVSRIEKSKHCTGGTEDVLTLAFNHSAWATLTDPAIRTANYLSSLLAIDNNTLTKLDDGMFYSSVRNNVHGDTLIFGSAIALEPGLYYKYEKFCPYAYKKNNSVSAFDIAVNYNYLLNSTEWYYAVKIKDFSTATVKRDIITYNFSDDSQINVPFMQPIATYPDGRWTLPYFDCGGGDIWMVTYSSPILFINSSGVPTFQGVATIDIELTNVDINQCDATSSSESGALDVFRGTHNCQPTTRCEALRGRGFNRGSYHCVCEDGYYFPHTEAEIKAFIGINIDNYIDTNATDMTSFMCLPCPRGCDTCVDTTPCLFQSNPVVRALVIFVIIIMILGCCCISFLVLKYRGEMVIKTASPIFLHLMCVGAILMCCHAFILYPESTDELCTIEIWPFHLGFSLMYGALIVKTWRISVIFSVGSVKRVNLPDRVLLQRLLPVVLFMVIYLSCWSGVSPPAVVTLTASNKLKFFACRNTLWTFAIYGVEAMLLLFGVYLCFTVRKAPAHFNESKHITWSTYNAIILGSFTLILTQLLAVSAGPDVLYILRMALLQALVTITMGLIFAPKFWALLKHSEWQTTNGNATITGRLKVNPTMTTHVPPGVRHMGIQTEDIYLTPTWTKDTAQSSHNSTSRPGSKHSAKVSPLELPHNSSTEFLST